VVVYDVTGRHVRTLASGVLGTGYHDLVWNGRDASGGRVAAGVYLVRAAAGDLLTTRKVMLLH
jgi:flagellar hook assembly protein FlgD